MAMYHFRIKSNKKPNEAKVSAVKHVEYINREGSFTHDELWKFIALMLADETMTQAFDNKRLAGIS